MKLIILNFILLSFCVTSSFSRDCPEGFFTGNFIVADESNLSTFDFFEEERPPGGDFDFNSDNGVRGLYKGRVFSMRQVNCSKVIVKHKTHPNPYYKHNEFDLIDHEFSFSIEPLQTVHPVTGESLYKYEKVNWTKNQFSVRVERIGSWKGWRKYHMVVILRDNGDLVFKRNVTGFALLPLPIPVKWSSTLVLQKTN